MLRLLLPLLSGVLIFLFSNAALPIIPVILIFFSLTILWLFLAKRSLSAFSLRWVFGIYISILLILAGYYLAWSRFHLHDRQHYSHIPQDNSFLQVRIIEPPSEKTNSWQLITRVTHSANDQQVAEVRGKLMLYLEKDSMAAELKYGDILWIEARYQSIEPPKNPHEFNYSAFLANQNIFHQSYRQSGQWYPSGRNAGNKLVALAHSLRAKALNILQQQGIKDREFALISALLLGFREYLDEDMRREFAGAGAMHILCVSGLHVGIIFMIISYMLKFLGRSAWGRILRAILSILCIWFYAAITGFSPSVLRASTMFSFVALGQSFFRSTNIYNTLAASALILIILDPFIIQRIGFQLSYLAVISIVSIQPLIYRQLMFKNFLADKAWGITSVSIAAQLGTGPLGLFYFNQFPNYFILTNLIVIPLAGFIIYAALLVILLSPLSWLAMIFAKILGVMLLVMHRSVAWIEGLPYSTTLHFYMGPIPTLLLLASLAIGVVFMHTALRKTLYFALILLFCFSLTFAYERIKAHSTDKLIVYHVRNAGAVDIFLNGNCYFRPCTSLEKNPRLARFHLEAHRTRMGLKNQIPILLSDSILQNTPSNLWFHQHFVQAGSKRIIFADRPELITDDPDLYTEADLVILSKPLRAPMKLIAYSLRAPQYVMDSSLSLYQLEQWLHACDSLKLNCWSVRHRGAFTMLIE